MGQIWEPRLPGCCIFTLGGETPRIVLCSYYWTLLRDYGRLGADYGQKPVLLCFIQLAVNWLELLNTLSRSPSQSIFTITAYEIFFPSTRGISVPFCKKVRNWDQDGDKQDNSYNVVQSMLCGCWTWLQIIHLSPACVHEIQYFTRLL